MSENTDELWGGTGVWPGRPLPHARPTATHDSVAALGAAASSAERRGASITPMHRHHHTPTASLSSLAPVQRTTPPLFSKYDPTGLDAGVRGRGRAGTMPSRWGSTGTNTHENAGTGSPMFDSMHEFAPFSPTDDQVPGVLKTLDYLGLSDGPAEATQRTQRDRAHTDAARIPPHGLRSSPAPGGPVASPLATPANGGVQHHGTRASAALQHRLSHLPSAYDVVDAGSADKPRATSTDRHDPPVDEPPLARAPGSGRHRADTVAALSGPDGRMRTELELQRTAHGAHENVLRARSASLQSDPATRLRAAQRGGDMDCSVLVTGLSPHASTRVLWRIFEPYGIIGDIRLFPSRGAAVVQFQEKAHAQHVADAGNAYLGKYIIDLIPDQNVAPVFTWTGADWEPGESEQHPGAYSHTDTFDAQTAPRAPMHASRHGGSGSLVPNSSKGGIPLPKAHTATLDRAQEEALCAQLHFSHGPDPKLTGFMPAEAHTYHTNIPRVVEQGRSNRRVDNARFRDLRRTIENTQTSEAQMDTIALECLDVIVELASNYIGNTIVQRFFDQCSETVKTRLLERLAPHLATIGIHKNGTWAAQKIIDRANTTEQQALITRYLQPYVPALLLDQYGNYVVQCVLPFGFPSATFILDAMVERCWEIAQGRFGARSMRTVLENPDVPREHIKCIALAIVLHCVPLATNANGSLLLTWLLDASGLDGVVGLIAPQLVPHITQVCTHKLASATVLRIVGQSADPHAARLLLGAIFDLPAAEVLEKIVLDSVHGAQLVAKALQSPMMRPDMRAPCADAVAAILERHELSAAPAYCRLAEQVGTVPESSAEARHADTHTAVRAAPNGAPAVSIPQPYDHAYHHDVGMPASRYNEIMYQPAGLHVYPTPAPYAVPLDTLGYGHKPPAWQ
ncbi:hypothetical protein MVES1_002215 [Malassezia vespertilionis]|uniref:uncharacterized protein n=1 Tax=Malassezia vespertilionis TaxID=2020962 RepID=UPI0024B23DEA|nr:uncharacterized protein MVES1_002215 [Malassezia vespertilionis]WFD06860.1 hypothetical protein MVES1_002215 [Malassezia vespertilionis]